MIFVPCFNYRTVSELVFLQEKGKENCSVVKMHQEEMLVLPNWQRTPELTPATAWKIWMTGRKIVSAFLNELFCRESVENTRIETSDSLENMDDRERDCFSVFEGSHKLWKSWKTWKITKKVPCMEKSWSLK